MNLQLWEKKFTDQTSLNMNLPPLLESHWGTIEHNFMQLDNKKKLIMLPFNNILMCDFRFNTKTVSIRSNLIQASILVLLGSDGPQYRPYSEERLI
jgi:hypothetical protein